jgi:hypothetical protein
MIEKSDWARPKVRKVRDPSPEEPLLVIDSIDQSPLSGAVRRGIFWGGGGL